MKKFYILNLEQKNMPACKDLALDVSIVKQRSIFPVCDVFFAFLISCRWRQKWCRHPNFYEADQHCWGVSEFPQHGMFKADMEHCVFFCWGLVKNDSKYSCGYPNLHVVEILVPYTVFSFSAAQLVMQTASLAL